jgi:hypothetical protein
MHKEKASCAEPRQPFSWVFAVVDIKIVCSFGNVMSIRNTWAKLHHFETPPNFLEL